MPTPAWYLCNDNIRYYQVLLLFEVNINSAVSHVAPAGQRVVVSLQDGYDIENTRWDDHAGNCQFDFLLFQDGPFEFSPNITRICGTGKAVEIASTGNFMRILFKTDLMVEKSGFNLTYEFKPIPGMLRWHHRRLMR